MFCRVAFILLKSIKFTEHPLVSKVNSSYTTELIINEWMLLARHNKKLYDVAAKHYKMRADTCMICVVISGSASGILNVALGAIGRTRTVCFGELRSPPMSWSCWTRKYGNSYRF